MQVWYFGKNWSGFFCKRDSLPVRGRYNLPVCYLGANFNLVHTEKRIVHIAIDAPEAMSKSEIEYGSNSWKSPLTFQVRMEWNLWYKISFKNMIWLYWSKIHTILDIYYIETIRCLITCYYGKTDLIYKININETIRVVICITEQMWKITCLHSNINTC